MIRVTVDIDATWEELGGYEEPFTAETLFEILGLDVLRNGEFVPVPAKVVSVDDGASPPREPTRTEP